MSSASASPWQTSLPSGILRCGVPRHLGGDGADLSELALLAQRTASAHSAAGWLLWAQRMAIEALVRSPNVALRDHLLEDLFTGERAATLDLDSHTSPLEGEDTGRGWRLHGTLTCVPNQQWEGFALVARVRLGEALGWALLRSEEDGLRAGDRPLRAPAGSASASLRVNGCFFREDEWLGGPELTELLRAVSRALGHPQWCASDAFDPTLRSERHV